MFEILFFPALFHILCCIDSSLCDDDDYDSGGWQQQQKKVIGEHICIEIYEKRILWEIIEEFLRYGVEFMSYADESESGIKGAGGVFLELDVDPDNSLHSIKTRLIE